MSERYAQVEKRFEELQQMLCDPAVLADGERYRELAKENTRLMPAAQLCRRHRELTEELLQARALAQAAEEPEELRELAAEEERRLNEELRECGTELDVLLRPHDPLDDRSVVLEIRAGAGGEESALFAASLLRMYMMYADRRGFGFAPLRVSETELGGVKEAVSLVSGEGAFGRFKFESGVHRVQRVPETESGGRIHTSTATVAVLPEAEEVELTIDPSELKIDTFRASGAGGQHINKTESAIRITHLPTGTVVECQDERSQYKNKDKAMRVLRSRLLEEKQQAQQQAISADRRSQVGTGSRNERIRTYNFPQGRVTDHRIGLTLYRLDEVLNGDLDEIVDALTEADSVRRAENSKEEPT